MKIPQLVHEISNFPNVLYQRGDQINFSKFTDKYKKQSSGGILSKDVFNNFVKFTDKQLARFSFLIKLQTGNLNLSENVTEDVL